MKTLCSMPQAGRGRVCLYPGYAKAWTPSAREYQKLTVGDPGEDQSGRETYFSYILSVQNIQKVITTTKGNLGEGRST